MRKWKIGAVLLGLAVAIGVIAQNLPATTNMGLVLPIPGQAPGPAWAQTLNTAFGKIDAHDHTTGKGKKVPIAGINFNADLPLANTYNLGAHLSLPRSVRLFNLGSPLSAAGDDQTDLYASGGNLYYNDAAGDQIQITSGAGLNASSIGAITGLGGTQGRACYDSATKSFWWRDDGNCAATAQAANMDMGSVLIRYNTGTSQKAWAISSPSGLAANNTTTLPAAEPVGTQLMQWDSSGVQSFFANIGGINLTIPGALTTDGGVILDGTNNNNPTLTTPTTNAGLVLRGNINAAGGGSDVLLNSKATRSNGLLLDVQNNGASKASVDWSGNTTIAGALTTTGGGASTLGGTLNFTGGGSVIPIGGGQMEIEGSGAQPIFIGATTGTTGVNLSRTGQTTTVNGALTAIGAVSLPAPTTTSISPNTNWAAIGFLAYWKGVDSVVHLKGAVQPTTGATNPAFTLPSGSRPLSTRNYACSTTVAGGASSITDYVSIGTNGDATILTAAHARPADLDTVYLDCVLMLAEQ